MLGLYDTILWIKYTLLYTHDDSNSMHTVTIYCSIFIFIPPSLAQSVMMVGVGVTTEVTGGIVRLNCDGV